MNSHLRSPRAVSPAGGSPLGFGGSFFALASFSRSASTILIIRIDLRTAEYRCRYFIDMMDLFFRW